MPLDDYVRKFLDDPDNEDAEKDNIRALMSSHIANGIKLQQQGLLYKAIEEFSLEHDRPINSDIDKEIVQTSYFNIGLVYRKLGEIEKAKIALKKAHELWRLHGVGWAPHQDLGEILVEEGQLDDAIELYQELLEKTPNGVIKQLLVKVIAMKNDRSK